jgi:microcystin degradation protein MlrC
MSANPFSTMPIAPLSAAPIANPSLMALSPGVVDQFVERLPRLHKAHPTFPFDKDFEWSPEAIVSQRARRT